MKLSPYCADCLRRKHTSNVPPDADPEKVLRYQQKVSAVIDQNCGKLSSPQIIRQIHAFYREAFGPLRDYTEEKKRFNSLMLGVENQVRERIDAAADPLYLAVCYAMIGNYIDFAALGDVDEATLMQMLAEAEKMRIDPGTYNSFREEAGRARRLVYLTDNCGEIVMDKLLMQTLRTLHPLLHISVIVRGAPVVNDATEEDALQVHLQEAADQVIGNGTDLVGQVLEDISEEARALLCSADVIISKGQANHEGLSGCGLPIYYMLLCKCHLFMELFNAPKFSPVLAREGKKEETHE